MKPRVTDLGPAVERARSEGLPVVCYPLSAVAGPDPEAEPLGPGLAKPIPPALCRELLSQNRARPAAELARDVVACLTPESPVGRLLSALADEATALRERAERAERVVERLRCEVNVLASALDECVPQTTADGGAYLPCSDNVHSPAALLRSTVRRMDAALDAAPATEAPDAR